MRTNDRKGETNTSEQPPCISVFIPQGIEIRGSDEAREHHNLETRHGDQGNHDFPPEKSSGLSRLRIFAHEGSQSGALKITQRDSDE
jgi:hypothetical protein